MILNSGQSSEKKETPSLIRSKKPASEESEAPKKTLLEERNTPFTNDQVKAAWDEFIQLRISAGASDTEKLVLARRLEKSGEQTMKIYLASQLENSILDRIEQHFIQHFRKSLDNTTITLEREVNEQEITQQLYTSREKFEYMAKQNPALLELKERLGLDFDF